MKRTKNPRAKMINKCLSADVFGTKSEFRGFVRVGSYQNAIFDFSGSLVNVHVCSFPNLRMYHCSKLNIESKMSEKLITESANTRSLSFILFFIRH